MRALLKFTENFSPLRYKDDNVRLLQVY